MTNLGAKWDMQQLLEDSQMTSLYHANREMLSTPSMTQIDPFKAQKHKALKRSYDMDKNPQEGIGIKTHRQLVRQRVQERGFRANSKLQNEVKQKYSKEQQEDEEIEVMRQIIQKKKLQGQQPDENDHLQYSIEENKQTDSPGR